MLKFFTDHIARIFTVFNEGTVVYTTNAFQSVLLGKYIVGHVMEAHKIGTPCFLC